MKSIIVTGASGNMGRAVVKRFAQDGQKVYAMLGPGENTGMFSEETMAPHYVDTQSLDLADEMLSESYLKGIIAKDPAIEAAVCIIGGWQAGTLSETTGHEIDKMIKLNFTTAFNIAKPLLEHFERQGYGQFIFIGARAAIKPSEAKNNVAYALSKSLVFRLAEIINDQGKSKNIHASVIVPSVLDTPQNRAAMPDADSSGWVKPEYVADTIAFLLGNTGNAMRETVIKLYNRA